jgi:hypothetical protein
MPCSGPYRPRTVVELGTTQLLHGGTEVLAAELAHTGLPKNITSTCRKPPPGSNGHSSLPPSPHRRCTCRFIHAVLVALINCYEAGGCMRGNQPPISYVATATKGQCSSQQGSGGPAEVAPETQVTIPSTPALQQCSAPSPVHRTTEYRAKQQSTSFKYFHSAIYCGQPAVLMGIRNQP